MLALCKWIMLFSAKTDDVEDYFGKPDLNDSQRSSLNHNVVDAKKWNHWGTDHNSDDPLKSRVQSSKSSPACKPPPWTDQSPQPNPPKKTFTFYIAQMTSPSDSLDYFFGTMLEEGAPYSGLDLNELKLLSPYLQTIWDGKLGLLPKAITEHHNRQYGPGSHRSESNDHFISSKERWRQYEICCNRRILQIDYW